MTAVMKQKKESPIQTHGCQVQKTTVLVVGCRDSVHVNLTHKLPVGQDNNDQPLLY